MPVQIGLKIASSRPLQSVIFPVYAQPWRLGEAAAAARLHLLLDLVRDLLLGFEELGGAPVEADGLALIELALAVVLGDALLGADGGHPGVEKIELATAIRTGEVFLLTPALPLYLLQQFNPSKPATKKRYRHATETERREDSREISADNGAGEGQGRLTGYEGTPSCASQSRPQRSSRRCSAGG